jgi:hypothetical protein
MTQHNRLLSIISSEIRYPIKSSCSRVTLAIVSTLSLSFSKLADVIVTIPAPTDR